MTITREEVLSAILGYVVLVGAMLYFLVYQPTKRFIEFVRGAA